MDPPAFRTPDAHMNRHIKELWHGGGKCPEFLPISFTPEASTLTGTIAEDNSSRATPRP
jgi:hypothetical protein